jgi:hypothetical protein
MAISRGDAPIVPGGGAGVLVGMSPIGYRVIPMAEYDPSDPATWAPTDAVDSHEISHRIGIERKRPVSAKYVAQNLSRRPDWPVAGGWTLNNGRWWEWGAVLDWFKANRWEA